MQRIFGKVRTILQRYAAKTGLNEAGSWVPVMVPSEEGAWYLASQVDSEMEAQEEIVEDLQNVLSEAKQLCHQLVDDDGGLVNIEQARLLIQEFRNQYCGEG